jgi:hypothetical protein
MLDFPNGLDQTLQHAARVGAAEPCPIREQVPFQIVSILTTVSGEWKDAMLISLFLGCVST